MSDPKVPFNFNFGNPEAFSGAKQKFEDGSNIAVGTPFREEFTTRVLPWYIPAEAKGTHNWRDNLAKLRSRFDNFIDEHCATECFLIQTLIPQIGEVPRKPPGTLPDRQLLCSGPGLRKEPAKLFGVQIPLAAAFPMLNVRGEPFLEPDGKAMPFRLGLIRYITVQAVPDGLRQLPIPKLTELLGDGKNILFQLPPDISVKIWRNWQSGFSQRDAQYLWLDALFEMSWQRERGGPFHTERYAWIENASVGLSGKGLFPRLPGLITSTPGEFAPHENGYPRAFYSKIADVARASVAAIDEILGLQTETVTTITGTTTDMKQISQNDVYRVAIQQMKANGSTTTLEIKNQFRSEGLFAEQQFVSDAMKQLAGTHGWTAKVTGNHLSYSPSSDADSNAPKNQLMSVPVIVLVTVNEHETQALLDAFVGAGKTPSQRPKGGVTYNDLGIHGGCRIIHTICEMGAGGVGASQERTRQAIIHWKPKAIIAVGIAFGVNEKKQKIGDILVSTMLQDYELGRLNKNGTVTPRGAKPSCADTLLNRVRQTDAIEKRRATNWPKLLYGLVLSGQKLVDNLDYRESLKALFTEAIGGEMEGTGLYVSATAAKVDWLVVKGICDWGHDKNQADKDTWQKLAAENAARVIKASLDIGGLYDDGGNESEADNVPLAGKKQNKAHVQTVSPKPPLAWPEAVSPDFVLHVKQLKIIEGLLNKFQSVVLHPEYPQWMSRAGILVRNPIWDQISAQKRNKLIKSHRIDGASPPDVMRLDLLLYRRNNEGGTGQLYTYYSEDWKTPMIHFRQRLLGDDASAAKLNAEKVARHWRVPVESVIVAPMPQSVVISVKPNAKTGNLMVYVYEFWSVKFTQKSSFMDEKLAAPLNKNPWYGLRALRSNKVSQKVNADVLDAIQNLFTVSLGPVPVSFPS